MSNVNVPGLNPSQEAKAPKTLFESLTAKALTDETEVPKEPTYRQPEPTNPMIDELAKQITGITTALAPEFARVTVDMTDMNNPKTNFQGLWDDRKFNAALSMLRAGYSVYKHELRAKLLAQYKEAGNL